MTVHAKDAFLAGLISCVAFGAWADGPTISSVEVRQRWPWNRLVNIDYTLSCEAGKSMDIRLSAFDGTNVLTLPECSLSGNMNGITCGVHRIVWNPLRTIYTHQALMRFNVVLTVTNTPLYAIMNLTQTNTPDQIQYLYEADLASGAYGTVATNPIPGVASLAWTGVTNGTSLQDGSTCPAPRTGGLLPDGRHEAGHADETLLRGRIRGDAAAMGARNGNRPKTEFLQQCGVVHDASC